MQRVHFAAGDEAALCRFGVHACILSFCEALLISAGHVVSVHVHLDARPEPSKTDSILRTSQARQFRVEVRHLYWRGESKHQSQKNAPCGRVLYTNCMQWMAARTAPPLVPHLLEGLALLLALADLGLDRRLFALQRAQLLGERPLHLGPIHFS